MKRTELKRVTPLARTGQLRRTATVRRRPRPDGTFSAAVRAQIMLRDGSRCVVAIRCDGSPGTAQTVNHIVNRGMGGSRSLNDVTNGIACCHACNGWLEDDAPARAYASGWKRKRGSPAGPVLYPDQRFWWLLEDGTRVIGPRPTED